MEADKYNLPAVLAEVNEKIRSIIENTDLTTAQREAPIQAAVGKFREFVESRLWIIPCDIVDVVAAQTKWDVTLDLDSLKMGVVTIRCEMDQSKALALRKGEKVQIQAKFKVKFTDDVTLALESASLAPAGLPVEAKEITFLGIKIKKPRSVVYVIDRSGSMTDSINYVKKELKLSISQLDEDSQFHVIFYSSGPPVEMPTRRLVNATERNKQLAFEFVNGVIAQGETDPSKALERAYSSKPEVIYLLTDGEFDRQIIDLVKRLNTGKKVVVHTIGFLYKTGEEILKKIASDNGGTYKFVSEADLAALSQQ